MKRALIPRIVAAFTLSVTLSSTPAGADVLEMDLPSYLPHGITMTVSVGASYRIEVEGTYSYARTNGVELIADAECSQGSPNTFAGLHPNDDWLDVYINSYPVSWVSKNEVLGVACDSRNQYRYDLTATASLLRLAVRDDIHWDNVGYLHITLTQTAPPPQPSSSCPDVIDWPGGEFQWHAAVNSTGEETTNTAGSCASKVYSEFNYQCPKGTGETAQSVTQTFGILETAELSIDSRANSTTTVTPYDTDTGHWGLYTCNWAGKGDNYRVLVSGMYRYDQTAPEGFGWADAECATGYLAGSDDALAGWGFDSRDLRHMFVPAHYEYFLDLITSTNAPGDPENKYREDVANWQPTQTASEARVWKPKRFSWINQGQFVDPFDLVLSDYGAALWRPIEEFDTSTWAYMGPASTTATFTAGCSPSHTYVLDYEPEGASTSTATPSSTALDLLPGYDKPLRFQVRDLVDYNEWDNCGRLSIRIEHEDQTGSEVPTSTYQDCNSSPPPWARIINVEDSQVNEFDDATGNADASHLYYFDPPGLVTNASLFNRFTGETVSNTVTWNFGGGPHSITAGLSVTGTACGPPNDPTGGSTGFVGRDDCDSNRTPRLFDSHASCPPACSTPQSSFQWVLSKPSNLGCPSGYCVIPYFCRVAPRSMFGWIAFPSSASP